MSRPLLTPVHLKGSLTTPTTQRWCHYCEQERHVAGGCQVTPTRFQCSSCWKSARGAANLEAGRLSGLEKAKRAAPKGPA